VDGFAGPGEDGACFAGFGDECCFGEGILKASENDGRHCRGDLADFGHGDGEDGCVGFEGADEETAGVEGVESLEGGSQLVSGITSDDERSKNMWNLLNLQVTPIKKVGFLPEIIWSARTIDQLMCRDKIFGIPSDE